MLNTGWGLFRGIPSTRGCSQDPTHDFIRLNFPQSIPGTYEESGEERTHVDLPTGGRVGHFHVHCIQNFLLPSEVGRTSMVGGPN